MNIIRDSIFLYFMGFHGSETIKNAQNLKLIAELNSAPLDGLISVNN